MRGKWLLCVLTVGMLVGCGSGGDDGSDSSAGSPEADPVQKAAEGANEPQAVPSKQTAEASDKTESHSDDGSSGGEAQGGDGSQPPAAKFGDPSGGKTGSKATRAVLTGALPKAIGGASHLQSEGKAITAAKGEVEAGSGHERLAARSGERLVRVTLTPDKADSMLGKVREKAAQTVSTPFLRTSTDRLTPRGALHVSKDGSMMLVYDAERPLEQRGLRRVPLAQFQDGEKIHLYFAVKPGATIEGYALGDTEQEIDGTLEVPE